MPDLEAKEVARTRKRIWRGDRAARGETRWLYLQVQRYAKLINGIDSLVITKLELTFLYSRR